LIRFKERKRENVHFVLWIQNGVQIEGRFLCYFVGYPFFHRFLQEILQCDCTKHMRVKFGKNILMLSERHNARDLALLARSAGYIFILFCVHSTDPFSDSNV